jgi:hypothetical protein
LGVLNAAQLIDHSPKALLGSHEITVPELREWNNVLIRRGQLDDVYRDQRLTRGTDREDRPVTGAVCPMS